MRVSLIQNICTVETDQCGFTADPSTGMQSYARCHESEANPPKHRFQIFLTKKQETAFYSFITNERKTRTFIKRKKKETNKQKKKETKETKREKIERIKRMDGWSQENFFLVSSVVGVGRGE